MEIFNYRGKSYPYEDGYTPCYECPLADEGSCPVEAEVIVNCAKRKYFPAKEVTMKTNFIDSFLIN